MKTLKPFTILLFSLFVALTVLSQTNSALNYLPKDANAIIKINPASLGQKMKWEELIKYKMFEDLFKDVPEEGKGFLNDPAQTGIDLKHGLFLVIPGSRNNQKLDPVFYSTPKDTLLIASMIKKIFPGKKPVKTAYGSIIVDKHTAFAWNSDIVILTGDDAKKGSIKNTKTTASTELTRLKQLTDRCKMLLRQHQSILTNEYFTSLLKEEADVYLWMNNNAQSQEQKKGKTPQFLGMLNKNFMRSGNYSSALIRFENGKVLAQTKRYVSASLDSIYKKYPAKNFNTELLKKLPAGHPILLGSFSFSPEMLNEIFVKAGADKYIDSVSKQQIKMTDIVSAVKGDVTLAGMKVYEFTEEDSVTQALNGMQVFLTGHISDKERFKTLVALLQKKNEDSANKLTPKMKPIILSNDSVFVVSISQIAGQKFLESSGKNEEIERLISPYQAHPSVFLLDLKTIFGFAMQTLAKGKSEEEAKQASEVLGMFDKLVSYGGEYNNNSTSSTVELTLTNKDENSLTQFMRLLDLFYSMKPKGSTASGN